jgi:adenylate cyclase
MGPAGAMCRTCGTELRHGARFCDGCGAPAPEPGEQAEFKQVTVLFADVVGSLAIASAVGAERLREMMADVFGRAATSTRRYGGTVNQFTGDGIMAVFGAAVALEEHAFRACLGGELAEHQAGAVGEHRHQVCGDRAAASRPAQCLNVQRHGEQTALGGGERFLQDHADLSAAIRHEVWPH